MERRTSIRRVTAAVTFVLAALLFATAGHAGFGDALKQKLKDKARQKTDQKVDEAIDKAAEGAEKKVTPKPGEAKAGAASKSEGGEASSDAAPAGPVAKVSEVSTKFDFVPGDKVILSDDFTQEDLGEFPAKFKPQIGTFEIAEMEKERWLRSMSDDGTVRLRLPEAPLPEYWTLEFDFHGEEPLESALHVRGMTKEDDVAWEMTFPSGGANMFFRSGEFSSNTPLEGAEIAGRHHVMVMARQKGIKCYVDRQRLVNLPEVYEGKGPAVALDIRLWANTHPMITNVRFAEGCKPAQDMLATGKLVTYGIRFATGSDVVLPESAPILRQVASWLEKNPTAKLTITGHTDNVGTAASNLDLSKRRAASVAKVLTEQFSIAADRLTPQGKGDTQAVADNATPEGRAMNRRVEFAKAQAGTAARASQ